MDRGREEEGAGNWVLREDNLISLSGLSIHSYREVSMHACIQDTLPAPLRAHTHTVKKKICVLESVLYNIPYMLGRK